MYYKVTNKKENHHGFQYVDGINILKEKFNANPNESCGAGDLYFTTLENIHEFYDYGINLREVSLPVSDPDFQMVLDPEGDKWRANKIILGKKYSLFDPTTYQVLGLDINENISLIDTASKYGRVDMLEWWKNSDSELEYNSNSINDASKNGHTNVLEWWKNSDLELKYTEWAINNASGKGHANVLEWWKSSGLKLEYTEWAINHASGKGHVNVLEWWKSSGLKLEYTYYAIYYASAHGHINVLEWWKSSGLEWWKSSGLELKYTSNAIKIASKNGHTNVLNWWKKSNPEIKYHCYDLVLGCAHSASKLLNKCSGLVGKYWFIMFLFGAISLKTYLE